MAEHFEWTEARILAAELIAAGELTSAEIGTRCGVTYQTLWNWKQVPEFATRIAETATAYGEVYHRVAVGRRLRRLQLLQDSVDRLSKVLDERAADPTMAVVPGGKTGTQLRTHKGLGSGEQFRVVEEFSTDVQLLRERRETLKQAAQECGQWLEKIAQTDPTGEKPAVVLTDEDKREYLLHLLEQAEAIREACRAEGTWQEDSPAPPDAADDSSPLIFP